MMKQEFEKLINGKVSDADYEVIEMVYTYYPSMTKDKAAYLYTNFGMVIFRDMMVRACEIRDVEEQIRKLESQLSAKRELLESLQKG